MPFKSKAQQKFLHAKKPEIAAKFDEETSKQQFSHLPEKVKKKAKKPAKKKGKMS